MLPSGRLRRYLLKISVIGWRFDFWSVNRLPAPALPLTFNPKMFHRIGRWEPALLSRARSGRVSFAAFSNLALTRYSCSDYDVGERKRESKSNSTLSAFQMRRTCYFLLLLIPIVWTTSLIHGQEPQPWVRAKIQEQIPLTEKLNFEPTRPWIQNYFASRETMAEETASLFRQLGSPNYQKRREAQKKILALPFVPQSLIEENLKAKNPEIKYFIKSVAKKRFDTERMYLHLAIWSISQKRIKGFAKQLIQMTKDDDEPFRRVMIPIAIAATVQPGDLKMLRKIVEEKSEASTDDESESVSTKTIAAVWGLTVLEKKHSAGKLEAKYYNADLELKLARGLALLYCNDAEGMKTLLPLLDCPIERIRVLSEKSLRNATGKWFGYVGANDSKLRESAINGWTKFVNSSDGNSIGKFDPIALQPELRLLGNVLIGFNTFDDKPGLFEMSPSGQVIYAYGDFSCFWAQKLANGNMLATIRDDGVSQVAEINAKGEVVWNYEASSILKCRLKPNGNVLICFQDGKKIIEVNRDKQIVWGMRVGERVNDVAIRPDGIIFLATDGGVFKVDQSGNDQIIFDGTDATGIEILPDGDLLIAAWKKRRFLQISPSGEKRWELATGQPAHMTRTIDGEFLVADGISGFVYYDSKRKLKRSHTGFSGRVYLKQ